MERPQLTQFRDLVPQDFDRHPVWVGCHTVDYEQPWYSQTDEETFRPWNGTFPASPSDGMLLVRATLQLQDRSRYPGFVTPAADVGDIGMQQPHIFVGNKFVSFWGGMIGVPTCEREAFYAALNKSADAIFPIHFSADSNLASGVLTGQIDGFY